MTQSLVDLIFFLETPQRHYAHFEFTRNSKGEVVPKFIPMADRDYQRILSSKRDLVNQRSVSDSLDLKYQTFQGINLLILSILFDIEPLFNRILSEKVYTPDELRQIKNSDGDNLMTICRNFKKLQYMDKIKSYISTFD